MENNNNNTIIINNTVAATGRTCNKWVSLALCFFLGMIGAHRFYEGKIGSGLIYMFTMGLCGFGVIFDFIALLFKPTHYVA